MEVLEPLARLLRMQKYRVQLDEFVQEKLLIHPFTRDNDIELDASAERIVFALLEWVNKNPHLGARPPVHRPSTAHARRLTPGLCAFRSAHRHPQHAPLALGPREDRRADHQGQRESLGPQDHLQGSAARAHACTRPTARPGGVKWCGGRG